MFFEDSPADLAKGLQKLVAGTCPMRLYSADAIAELCDQPLEVVLRTMHRLDIDCLQINYPANQMARVRAAILTNP